MIYIYIYIYVDLQYDEMSHFYCWVCVLVFACGHVVVFGLSVRLSWYPMWIRWLIDCDACTVVGVTCVYAERV